MESATKTKGVTESRHKSHKFKLVFHGENYVIHFYINRIGCFLKFN